MFTPCVYILCGFILSRLWHFSVITWRSEGFLGLRATSSAVHEESEPRLLGGGEIAARGAERFAARARLMLTGQTMYSESAKMRLLCTRGGFCVASVGVQNHCSEFCGSCKQLLNRFGVIQSATQAREEWQPPSLPK